MSETIVIAEELTLAPGFLRRFLNRFGEWPISEEDLDRAVMRLAGVQGMRVLSVGEANQRGPLPVYDVDDDGHIHDEVIAEKAQLWAYVEWEAL